MKVNEIVISEEKQKGVDGKACWDGYKRMGTKKKGGKTVDNCVKVGESATAGATSAANVGIGVAYPNKKGKTAKNKDGTVKNALDMPGTNLITGGSIGKQRFIKR